MLSSYSHLLSHLFIHYMVYLQIRREEITVWTYLGRDFQTRGQGVIKKYNMLIFLPLSLMVILFSPSCLFALSLIVVNSIRVVKKYNMPVLLPLSCLFCSLSLSIPLCLFCFLSHSCPFLTIPANYGPELAWGGMECPPKSFPLQFLPNSNSFRWQFRPTPDQVSYFQM